MSLWATETSEELLLSRIEYASNYSWDYTKLNSSYTVFFAVQCLRQMMLDEKLEGIKYEIQKLVYSCLHSKPIKDNFACQVEIVWFVKETVIQ